MPKCEICYEDVDKVYTCKLCGVAFCEDCGDPKRRICALCIDEEEGEEEDLDEEHEDEEFEDEEEPEEEDEEEEEFEEEEEERDERRKGKKSRYQVR